MKVIPGSAAYWELFDGFQRSAYRLEGLQRYRDASEEDPLRAFLAGEPRPPLPGKDGWTARIRAVRGAGKTMSRVHVVDEPLSDYLRFELGWSYPPNVAAGEDIRIMPRSVADDLGLPARDYWLFDDTALLWVDYTPAGERTGAELEEDPAIVRQAVRWRDIALTTAIPLGNYVSGQPARRAS